MQGKQSKIFDEMAKLSGCLLVGAFLYSPLMFFCLPLVQLLHIQINFSEIIVFV